MKPAYHYRNSVRIRASRGQWESELVQISFAQAQERCQAADWINYIDITQSIRGISWQEWLHIAKLYITLNLSSAGLRLRLLNLILTPGLLQGPDDSERSAWNDRLSAIANPHPTRQLLEITHTGYLGTRISHYPVLLSQSDNVPGQQLLYKLSVQHHITRANALIASRIPFEKALRDMAFSSSEKKGVSTSALKVAVVGNSPTLLHEKKGDEIDSSDIVIRFNNAPLFKNNLKHTGSRTDIWVMSPSTSVDLCPQDAKIVVVSGLHPLDRASFFWRKLPCLDKKLTQLPASVWYELVSCFQAPPSAGILMMASLNAQQQDFDLRQYGFTTNVAQISQLPNHHADNKPRSSRHNWEAEARWLRQSIT